VSLLTRKDAARGDDGASQSVLGAAAQQVVPIARNAGQACRQGVEGAARWARPRVQGARSWAEPQVRVARTWAAPRVEQAGVAVREKIAPTVSSALLEASRRLDAVQPPQPQQKRRLWPRLVAAVAMLAAAGSAAAAVFLKRQADGPAGSEDQIADDQAAPPAGHPGGAMPTPGRGAHREGDGTGEGTQPQAGGPMNMP
jgi:hypothetical protein